jgi:hypothetical protein
MSWLRRLFSVTSNDPPVRAAHAGELDGVHHSDKLADLDLLHKSGRLAEYEQLLWRCVHAAESESAVTGAATRRDYYDRLADLYRGQIRPAEVEAILNRALLYQQPPSTRAASAAKLRAGAARSRMPE